MALSSQDLLKNNYDPTLIGNIKNRADAAKAIELAKVNYGSNAGLAGQVADQVRQQATANGIDMTGLGANDTLDNVRNILKSEAYGAAAKPATQTQPDYQGRINSIYDQQRAAQLAQLKSQRDKATGDINLQKQELAPQYQNIRNQTDVGNVAAVQKLREAMASQGLLSSGDNNTEMTNLRINRENALNNTNLQERQQINQLDRRIADINDPSQEQAMIANIEAARNQAMLNELYEADQRNFRNSQFDYQKQRDQVGDTRWQTEFDYKKNFDQKQFDEDVRRFGVQQAMQLAGITGFYDGKPTFAREQFNSENDYRNRSLALSAAKAAASAAKSTGTGIGSGLSASMAKDLQEDAGAMLGKLQSGELSVDKAMETINAARTIYGDAYANGLNSVLNQYSTGEVKKVHTNDSNELAKRGHSGGGSQSYYQSYVTPEAADLASRYLGQ